MVDNVRIFTQREDLKKNCGLFDRGGWEVKKIPHNFFAATLIVWNMLIWKVKRKKFGWHSCPYVKKYPKKPFRWDVFDCFSISVSLNIWGDVTLCPSLSPWLWELQKQMISFPATNCLGRKSFNSPAAVRIITTGHSTWLLTLTEDLYHPRDKKIKIKTSGGTLSARRNFDTLHG